MCPKSAAIITVSLYKLLDSLFSDCIYFHLLNNLQGFSLFYVFCVLFLVFHGYYLKSFDLQFLQQEKQ